MQHHESFKKSKPILSICIPTYNRAELLRSALLSLLPQVAEFSDEVEVVVSDNASTDHTSDVIEFARGYGFFRYTRNTKNIGAAHNLMYLANDLANGEYFWIIGDDDMIIYGALQNILELLKKNEYDYYFINYFLEDIKCREKLIFEHGSYYTPSLDECMCKDLSWHAVQKWEDIFFIDNKCSPALFTGIASNIFKTSFWREHSSNVKPNSSGIFSSLDTAFPHLKVIATGMFGRPAYYIGSPLVMLGQGAQEWLAEAQLGFFIRLNDALDLYRILGLNKSLVLVLRKRLVLDFGNVVFEILRGRKIPGHENFNLKIFFLQNRGCLAEWATLFLKYAISNVLIALPRPVYNILRKLKNTFFIRFCFG